MAGKIASILLFPFKTILIIAFFPLYAIFTTLRPIRVVQQVKQVRITKAFNLKTFILKSLIILLTLFILLPTWVLSYYIGGITIANKFKLLAEPIPISGTGSMYPTFPKGQNKNPQEQAKEIVSMPGMTPYPNGIVLFGKRYFGNDIQRGDIVTFSNSKASELTEEISGEAHGMVKRVVALPGDEIEIRSGMVILNGKPLAEPYTAKARSTFGGVTLTDCQKLQVPQGRLFVMGDNRKGSSDSRHDLGLISISDVDHVLPLSKQNDILDTKWRDTESDFSDSAKIKVNKNKYLEFLNEKRKTAGVKALKYNEKLEKSAVKRGENMLKFNDLSFEATRSGYTMDKATQDVGYYNITWGEAPTLGYYEADELIENFFEFPDSKKFLLNKDYQDFGIAEVEGIINGCPAQVVVQHFGGYVPPNYKQGDIDAWKKALSNLKEIQPGWSNLKDAGEYYQKNQADIDRINNLISTQISHTESIVKKIEANQWLSKEEENFVSQSEENYKQIDTLTKKLNNRE